MGKIKRYKYSLPHNWWRYSILLITILSIFSGSLLVIDLLDPYSNFGRITANLLRPIVIFSNNVISGILLLFKNFSLAKIEFKFPNPVAIIFPLSFLIFIFYLAIKRGRFYCNVICPVGTILGLLSRISFYKIQINQSVCTLCGNCVKVCKSECIDIRNHYVDVSRCVGCMNCIDSCSENGIKYNSLKERGNIVDHKKRMTFIASFSMLAGLLSMSPRYRASGEHRYKAGEVPVKKNFPSSPPGSKSIEHFTTYCTACHLCVSACPTQVLQPALFQYGIEGVLQPRLDASVNFCNFDCIVCTEICPSGAIMPLTVEQKHRTQTGRVHFIKQSCVVFTDKKDCGACSEHCPTKAVQMVPWKYKLKIPEVNNEICIGCSACEFACPTKPYKAIYVDGNYIHQLAKQPIKVDIEEGFNPDNDFPF